MKYTTIYQNQHIDNLCAIKLISYIYYFWISFFFFIGYNSVVTIYNKIYIMLYKIAYCYENKIKLII